MLKISPDKSVENIRQSISGLTLMELMVVIAIIGIVSAFAIPWLLNPEHKVKKVARELTSDMQLARISAIKQNRPFRIEFNTANNSYIIIDSQGDENLNGDFFDDGNERIVKTISFSGYAMFGDGSGGSNAVTFGANKLSFNPQGTCNGGFVYIQHRNAAYRVGTLSTGIIRMQRLTGGEWK